MTTAPHHVDLQGLRIEPLVDPAELANFDSGESEVDKHVDKCCDWHQRFQRRVYCAHVSNEVAALGFYSIGVSAADSKYVDRDVVGTHGVFGPVPFIYLHYIAVRSQYQSNGIGEMLLLHALEQAADAIQRIGNYGVALNALNERVAGLYDRYGFRAFDENMKYPLMVLPARSVLELFSPDQ